ncbi:MAG: hypothetical protein J6J16_06755 [Lachnospiraceae bacterium]|nr:hypothetical protein [Lachnospiraceae bacterium]
MGEKLVTIITAVAVVVLGPYILTSIINGRQGNVSAISSIDTGRDVIIQIDGQNQLIDVEEYIVGVLPGLVDWQSDMDIIEAQAVAVRGKIYYAMGEETVIWASNLEYTYYAGDELTKRLGKGNVEKAVKIYEKAVINTKGIIE